MLKIALTGSVYTLIDDADLLLVSGFPWRGVRTKPGAKTLYVHAWNNRQSLYMHRLILGCALGDITDHADGDGLNNQRWNLRVANANQSQDNRGKQRNGRTSQYKGVYWDKSRNRWSATIHHEKRTTALGRYAQETDAARAYDDAATDLFGSFARLNFPTENGVVCLRHQMSVPEAFCCC